MKIYIVIEVLKDLMRTYGDIEVKFECPLCHRVIIPTNLIHSEPRFKKEKLDEIRR